jgi:hypothetical protein
MSTLVFVHEAAPQDAAATKKPAQLVGYAGLGELRARFISLRWTQCQRLPVERARGGKPCGSFSRDLFRQRRGILR